MTYNLVGLTMGNKFMAYLGGSQCFKREGVKNILDETIGSAMILLISFNENNAGLVI
ncbi:MAG: hypothetical protein HXX14_13965 [Bacteroidetes bacterium]|nr:hypothetical protein [Bacteroidota bacterium]